MIKLLWSKLLGVVPGSNPPCVSYFILGLSFTQKSTGFPKSYHYYIYPGHKVYKFAKEKWKLGELAFIQEAKPTG